ncbi:hypothetical protein [Streptomyces sp. TS71-3]|uniref:hypothetical protein n=1 Tax=Streptomyces sp. TS71-3 TaxID=2733862 RepID=UPI001B0A3B7A|nr:hypothetical protein [Streptomyces sp. TS71-3]GHJ37512.1 hypothetical protein Sm713_31210 [Streptomyces sp. TS71-3]
MSTRLDELSGIQYGQPYEVQAARAANVTGGEGADFRRRALPVAQTGRPRRVLSAACRAPSPSGQ